MCIEREKVDFKSREVNCLKECALALMCTVTVTDEGSSPEMRIWSILLIKSDC